MNTDSAHRRFPTLPVEEVVLWLWADVRYFAMPTPRSDALKGRSLRQPARAVRVRASSRPRTTTRRALTPRRRQREALRVAA
ncbi:MAG: hypothetical protein AB7K71_17445 [Polyangiaceae bacterium]